MANFKLDGAPLLKYSQFEFSGGLNTKANAYLAAPEDATALTNLVFSNGVLKKRPGRKIDPTFPIGSFSQGLHQQVHYIGKNAFDKTNGDKMVLYTDGSFAIREASGTLYNPIRIFNGDGTPYTADHHIPVTVGGRYVFGTFFTHQEGLYYYSPTAGLLKYNGKDEANNYYSFTQIPAIPKGSMAVVHKERVFYAGDPEHPAQFYASQIGNAESIEASVTDPNSGATSTARGGAEFHTESEVTGLTVFHDQIIVFNRHQVHSLSGTTIDDFTLNTLNIFNGCYAPFSVQRLNNMVVWLSNDGVYAMTNPAQDVLTAQCISEKITPDLLMMKDNFYQVKSFYFESKYYLSDTLWTYVLDEMLGTWTKFTLGTNHFFLDEKNFRMLFTTGTYTFYFQDGQLYDELDLEGGKRPVYGLYQGPYLRLSDPEKTKRFKWIKLFIKPNAVRDSTIKMTLSVDYNGITKTLDAEYITFVWGSSKWGDYLGDPRDDLGILTRFGAMGESIQITLENDEIDSDLEIHGYVLAYKLRSRVR